MVASTGKTETAIGKRLYSKQEFARRGDALIEGKVRPNLTAGDKDRFVAIDIETGEYELGSE